MPPCGIGGRPRCSVRLQNRRQRSLNLTPAPILRRLRRRPRLRRATFEYLNIEQILALADPKWLIDKLVIEQSLGFIYGPPGSLKTFIGLDIALSLATKQSNWWGYPVQRNGTVIYISSEGHANLKFRIRAWEQHRKVPIAGLHSGSSVSQSTS